MNIVSSFVIFSGLLLALSFPQAIFSEDIPEEIQERFGFSSLENIKRDACKYCEGRFGFILGKKILCSVVCGGTTTTTTSKPEMTTSPSTMTLSSMTTPSSTTSSTTTPSTTTSSTTTPSTTTSSTTPEMPEMPDEK